MTTRLLAVCMAATAACWAQFIPSSGEHVIINDNEYVIVWRRDWENLTNSFWKLERVAKRRWERDHATYAGRASWHGEPTNRVVTADAITWLYGDGYTFTERAPRRTSQEAAKPPPAASPRLRPNVLPPRLAAKQEASKGRRKPRVVNAVFGAGGKVISAEERK